MPRIDIDTGSRRQHRGALSVALLVTAMGHIFAAHSSSCSNGANAVYPFTHPPIERDRYSNVEDVVDSFSLRSTGYSEIYEKYKTRSRDSGYPFTHSPIERDRYFNVEDVVDSFSLRSTGYSEIYEKYKARSKDGGIHTYNMVSLHALENIGAEYDKHTYVGVVWNFNHDYTTYGANVVCDKKSQKAVKNLISNMLDTGDLRSFHINNSCIKHDMFDARIVADIAFNYGDGCDSKIIGKLFGEQSYTVAREAFFSYIMTECIYNVRRSISEHMSSYPIKLGIADDIHNVALAWLNTSEKDPERAAHQCSALAEYKQDISRALERISAIKHFRAINFPTCNKPWTILRSNTKEEYALIDYIIDDTAYENTKSARLIVSLTDFDNGSLSAYTLELNQADSQNNTPILTIGCNEREKKTAGDYYSSVKPYRRASSQPMPSGGKIPDTELDAVYKVFYDKWKMACEAKESGLSDPGNTVAPDYLYNEGFGANNRGDIENEVRELLRASATERSHIDNYTNEDIGRIARQIMTSPSLTYSCSNQSNKHLTLIEFHTDISTNRYGTLGQAYSSSDMNPSDAMLVISVATDNSVAITEVNCFAQKRSSADNDEISCASITNTSKEYPRGRSDICNSSTKRIYNTLYKSPDAQIVSSYTTLERVPYGNRERREREKFIRDMLANGFCREE